MALMNVLTNIRYWVAAALISGLTIGEIDSGIGKFLIMFSLIAMMSLSLTGLRFSKEDVTEKKKDIILAVFCCYCVSLASILLLGIPFGEEMWQGWVIMAAVPCAISVIPSTLIMKGDTKLSVVSVAVMYIMAIALTPLLTQLLIGNAVDPIEILKYVMLFVLLPFIISVPLKRIQISPNGRGISLNILYFILIFVAFGNNRDFIFNEPVLVLEVALAVIIRLAVVWAAVEFILMRLGMNKERRVVMILSAIWKNSALAMTLAMILFAGQPHAALPGAVAVPLEMIWFMFLMWYYDKKCPSSERPKGHLADGLG